MGKKKKSFYKRTLKPFVSDNRVLLAALGGVAAGISVANILGSEKARQIVETIEHAAKDYGQKIKQSFTHDEGEPEMKVKKRNAATGSV